MLPSPKHENKIFYYSPRAFLPFVILCKFVQVCARLYKSVQVFTSMCKSLQVCTSSTIKSTIISCKHSHLENLEKSFNFLVFLMFYASLTSVQVCANPFYVLQCLIILLCPYILAIIDLRISYMC